MFRGHKACRACSVADPRPFPKEPFFQPNLERWKIQTNPRVRTILVRNSGAGNGRANFMGA